MSKVYKIYGLNINSEIEFKNFPLYDENADVYIKRGKNPKEIDNPNIEGVFFQAKENHYLLKINPVLSFYIHNKNTIIVDADANTSDKDIRLYLLGIVCSALLYMHDITPLHGNTIVKGSHCITICGVSGAGKSTISAALHQQGWVLMSDDVSAVTIKGKNIQIHPGIPYFKLWKDSEELLNFTGTLKEPITEGIEKNIVWVNQIELQKKKATHIFIIKSHNKKEIEIKELKGMQKFNEIRTNVYRPILIKGLDKSESFFYNCAEIADKTRVFVLIRPMNNKDIQGLTDTIIRHLS